MKCKNCMAELEEGSLFCPECGARADNDSDKTVILQEDMDAAEEAEEQAPVFERKVYEEPARQGQVNQEKSRESQGAESEWAEPKTVESAPAAGEEEPELCFCPNCGNKIDSSSVFCEFCGYKMDGSSEEESSFVQEDAPAAKKKFKLPVIIGGVAAVAVIAAAGLFLAPRLIGGGGSKTGAPAELMYIKDRGLYGISLKNSKQKPVEYVERFADSEYISTAANEVSTGYQMISDDGKYHFLMKDVDYGQELNYTLMYKKGKKEPEKIDSGIEGPYRVTSDNKVVYKKNGNLYVSDLKDKQKLASDVYSFRLDKEEKHVLWQVEGDDSGYYDIYYQDLAQKKDKIKIDSNVKIVTNSSDLNTILLMKEGSVYLVRNQEDKQKLAGDVQNIFSVDLQNGSFFYTVSVEGSAKAIDFVDDDLAASDAQIKEPVRANYERQETSGTGIFSYTRTVVDDKFYEDQDKYQEKKRRDELRSQLKEMDIYTPYTELYYYAGGEKTLVTSDFIETSSYGYITEKDKEANKNFSTYLVYTRADAETVGKIKLSEISYAGDVQYMINNTADDTVNHYLYAGGTEVELDLEDKRINTITKDAKNNQLFCLTRDSDAEYSDGYDLISINLSASSLGEITERDSDVDNLELVVDGNVYYTKDTNDRSVGDLYLNGDMIVADVSSYSLQRVPESSVVLCISDPNRDKNMGTLTMIRGKKSEKVADDVNFFYAFTEKSIAMLTEYNYDKSKGDLRYYNGKETYMLDSDVRNFIATY